MMSTEIISSDASRARRFCGGTDITEAGPSPSASNRGGVVG